MGKITTRENQNKTLDLEITYGGVESPFGGIDTSAPPAYIDPKCFTAADGFLVVDNKLCAISLVEVQNPELWNNATGVQLLGAGTFFNSIYGQLNYVLGYKAVPFSGPPSGVNYNFYMTSWVPSNPATVFNDILPITLYDGSTIPQAASITLDCIQTNNGAGPTTGVTGTVNSINGSGGITGLTLLTFGAGYLPGMQATLIEPTNPAGVGAVLTVLTIGGGGSVATYSYTPGHGYTVTSVATAPSELTIAIDGTRYTIPSYLLTSRGAAVSAMVTQINLIADPNVIASASVDGYSLILTAKVAGTAGNSITVQDFSFNGDIVLPPPFYFSCVQIRDLEGGSNSVTGVLAPRAFTQASICEVGGILYIANLGPMILQYGGPGNLTTNTMYLGVNVIRKFAGALLGLGLVNQLGVFTQNQDMILVWSASEVLTEWAPLNSANNVTGAGFEQLADISDALTGLIVSNNTAFFIRQQGVSYATATGNGTEPYSTAHISLGDNGEGCQNAALVIQYDQLGAFIGNTNVYGVNQGTQPIGDKIKNAIFSFMTSLPDPIPSGIAQQAAYLMSSNACGINAGETESVFYAFLLGPVIYLYNAVNQTWMQLTYTQSNTALNLVQGVLATLSNSSLSSPNQSFSQRLMTLVEGLYNNSEETYIRPAMYSIVSGLQSSNIAVTPTVTFPIEEILFGREVIIDSLLIGLIIGTIPVSTFITVQFMINGLNFAQLTLTPADNTESDNPIIRQLFPMTGVSTFAAVSPQLSYTVTYGDFITPITFEITKIAMFGSFDPMQRPV